MAVRLHTKEGIRVRMIIYYGINSIYKPIGLLEYTFATGGLMMSFEYLKKGRDPRFAAVLRIRRGKKTKRRKAT